MVALKQACFPKMSHNPMSETLAQVFTYMKCDKKMTMLTCIKHDLKKYPEEFELQGLDGMLEHAAEEDKMFAVVLAHASFKDEVY